MKRTILFISAAIFFFASCQKETSLEGNVNGRYTVKLSFINFANGNDVELDSVTYINDFGEDYTISKLRYYITNIQLRETGSGHIVIIPNSYYLIDESNANSKSMSWILDSGRYDQVSFLIGVDSARNVSGAQTGALDPANNMFWTWNSGYIQFKLEGKSPASTAVNNKIEYHIGGFKSTDNTVRRVTLNLPLTKLLNIQSGSSGEVIIGADIDRLFNNTHALNIAANPVCTTPGALAVKYADNYEGMFFIFDVINN
jgi:hypothetical protein